MFKYMLIAGSAALLILGSLLAGSDSASAHERRNVLSYTFVVGFLNEPALLNEPNSLDLRISRTADSAAVEGLEATLKAEVKAQGKTLALEIKRRFGAPGAYNAYFMPTAAGEYTFHIFGTIEGNAVDETFTSSPNTFSSVNAPVGFPEAYAAPSAGNGLSETIGSLEERVVNLEAKGSDDSGTAMAVGIVGIIVGALGLAAGGFAITRSKA
jgi:hypothetical protein